MYLFCTKHGNISSSPLTHEATTPEPHVYKNAFDINHDTLKESAFLKVTPHNQNGEQNQAEVSRFLGWLSADRP